MTADTPTTAKLDIPQAASDAARDAFWDCLPDTYEDHDMAFLACYLEEFALPAAAGKIVASELRRLADLHEAPRIDWEPSDLEAADLGARDEIAGALRARADELDSQ